MIQNKYIIRLSFIAIFINIIGSVLLYRYFMLNQIINQTIAQNVKIAKTYKSEVWDNHQSAIAKLKATDYKNLLNDQDFVEFLKHSFSFFKSTNSYVSLFDMYGNKILVNEDVNISTVAHYRGANFYDKLATKLDRYFLRSFIQDPSNLTKSFLGWTYNFLLLNALIDHATANNTSKAMIVTSYLPIIDHDLSDFLVDLLLEIHTDISEQWDNISSLGQRVSITFIVIFLVFFSIIIYNTNYAQSIINKQFETNRALKSAKLIAENENSAKTEFLANVSHELRTPLNAIIGFSDIIISEAYGKINNPQYLDYVNDINNSGKHLLSVINDILDFSKASADKLQVEHIELDLNKLASSSMRFVKPRADEAKVKLIEDLPQEHIVIKADPKRLKQTLLNLLSNSVKFTPEGGCVTLKVIKDQVKHLVYIQVTDTGIGLSEKDIPKALSSFGQIDNKLSRKYEGTGLGLPLTKKLVELMQGQFDLQSKVGFGTTVTLTFQYDESI